ncbi:hypothetical protein PROFUN_16850 [Planoprotostelium fungivorum]|uniref:Uncharacterized protein n=1 Tax=Planoprotostelium fungivorum TaxID=1890364 RepID=A0A2P6MNL6_9EUKA|nr:hypothetical protein PROFUN_16850 [Planoprotostelium fungivorum]
MNDDEKPTTRPYKTTTDNRFTPPPEAKRGMTLNISRVSTMSVEIGLTPNVCMRSGITSDMFLNAVLLPIVSSKCILNNYEINL